MKILIPFNSPERIGEFIRAGAEEFYYGFYDSDWTQRFGKYADLNRMSGYGISSNSLDFDSFLETTELVNREGGQSFLTMNPGSYSRDELDYIEENYIPKFKESKIDGVIASDLNLIKLLGKHNLSAVASTICGIYNSDIAKAFIDLGVKRLIVPRDLSLDEIESIKSELPEEIKLEVFFMRNGCIFSDGYCMGMHRTESGATCSFIRNHYKNFMSRDYDFSFRSKLDQNDQLYNRSFHMEACGLCALYRLMNAGVDSLKIVGRSDDPDLVLRDIELIRKNIELAKKCNSELEYLENMIKPENSDYKCRDGMQCYYPEVRFS